MIPRSGLFSAIHECSVCTDRLALVGMETVEKARHVRGRCAGVSVSA
jgi:hypothetical protein